MLKALLAEIWLVELRDSLRLIILLTVIQAFTIDELFLCECLFVFTERLLAVCCWRRGLLDNIYLLSRRKWLLGRRLLASSGLPIRCLQVYAYIY